MATFSIIMITYIMTPTMIEKTMLLHPVSLSGESDAVITVPFISNIWRYKEKCQLALENGSYRAIFIKLQNKQAKIPYISVKISSSVSLSSYKCIESTTITAMDERQPCLPA